MSETSYVTVLDLAAGGLLLSAVLVVWRRDLAALVRLLSWQGVALAAIPVTLGAHLHDAALLGVGVGVGVLRAVVIPRVVARLLLHEGSPRETEPVLNTVSGLLAVAVLTALAYATSRSLVALDPTPATHAIPLALAVVLIGILVLVTRRRALSQVVGLLLLDNGIAAVAFLATAGVALVVELGASLDVLLAVLVLQLLGDRMRISFGGTDLGELRELHE